MSHQRAAGHYQVRTSSIERLVNQEILLLPAEVHTYTANVLIKVITNVGSGFVEGVNRTNKRSLIVEGFTRVCYEDRRDAEAVFNHERWRSGVPSRVTTRLKRIADTAIWER